MRLCLVLLGVSLFAKAQLQAAPAVKFPYETTIEAEGTYVRSGPGSKYYPTGKLKRGQTVVVHRHDPGGWFMIAPPAGSFSWIPAKHVQKSAADRGTVNANSIVVRVGSFESDIRELFQRKLSQGDEVKILGEKMLAPETGGGPEELWYKIEPPRGEWRWILGQAVAPPANVAPPVPSDDPFDVKPTPELSIKRSPPVPPADPDEPGFEKPVPATRDYLANDPLDDELKSRPLVRREGKEPPKAGVAAKRTNAKNAKLDGQLDELDRLDARFRSILDKNPREWDFADLQKDYLELKDRAETEHIVQMIDTRLDRIPGYEKQRSDALEQDRREQETLRRDAELADIQRRHEAAVHQLRQPRFDGAGIVDRSAITKGNGPRYVLVAPNGRILAYLAAGPGVNLEPWIGRPAGITGPRVRHPDLKADMLTVTGITPVRLAP